MRACPSVAEEDEEATASSIVTVVAVMTVVVAVVAVRGLCDDMRCGRRCRGGCGGRRPQRESNAQSSADRDYSGGGPLEGLL